jgi:hypothetical protein
MTVEPSHDLGTASATDKMDYFNFVVVGDRASLPGGSRNDLAIELYRDASGLEAEFLDDAIQGGRCGEGLKRSGRSIDL